MQFFSFLKVLLFIYSLKQFNLNNWQIFKTLGGLSKYICKIYVEVFGFFGDFFWFKAGWYFPDLLDSTSPSRDRFPEISESHATLGWEQEREGEKRRPSPYPHFKFQEETQGEHLLLPSTNIYETPSMSNIFSGGYCQFALPDWKLFTSSGASKTN